MEKEKPLKRDIRKSYEELLRDPRWTHYSNLLKAERGNTCEICGESEEADEKTIEVHHLGYRGIDPWGYKDSEVLVICRECHANIHHYADEIWNLVLTNGNQYVIHECFKAVKAVLERHPYSRKGSGDVVSDL